MRSTALVDGTEHSNGFQPDAFACTTCPCPSLGPAPICEVVAWYALSMSPQEPAVANKHVAIVEIAGEEMSKGIATMWPALMADTR